MKVAIIGSGISALSCAHELKKHGIIPTIFEKGLALGGKLSIPLLSLRMLITPYRNPFKYLSKKYDINIKPYSSVNEISIVTQNKVLNVKGKLGYLMARPPYYDAIDYQIEKQVNLPVNYNSNVEIEELMKEFDYVVVASADMGDSKKFSSLSQTFVAQVRIAHVLGNFRLDFVKIWFNTKYAKQGYAYILPISITEARLILIVDNISESELNNYWDKFLLTENIQYHIIETRDLKHIVGNVNPIQYKNLYFVGNTGGFIDSFIGIGGHRAIMSGVTAARSIVYNLDYNKLMLPIIKDIWNKYEFRRTINFITDRSFDRLITFLKLPIIKQLVFKNPLFKITMVTSFFKLYNRIIIK